MNSHSICFRILQMLTFATGFNHSIPLSLDTTGFCPNEIQRDLTAVFAVTNRKSSFKPSTLLAGEPCFPASEQSAAEERSDQDRASIFLMTTGSSILAIILTSPPHSSQVSMSILNTLFNRIAHVIEARFSAGDWSCASFCFGLAAFTPWCRCHQCPILAIGCKHSVETGQVNAWFRNKGNH